MNSEIQYFPEPSDVFSNDAAKHEKYLTPLASIKPDISGLDIDTVLHFVCPIEPCDGCIGEYTKPAHSYYCRMNWVAFDVTDGKYSFKGPEDFFLLSYLDKNPDALKGCFPKFPAYENQLPKDLKAHYQAKNESYQNAKSKYVSGALDDDYLSSSLFLGGYSPDLNWAHLSDMPIDFQAITASSEEHKMTWGQPEINAAELQTQSAYPLTEDGRKFQYIGRIAAWSMGLLACEMYLFYDPQTKIALSTFDWS